MWTRNVSIYISPEYYTSETVHPQMILPVPHLVPHLENMLMARILRIERGIECVISPTLWGISSWYFDNDMSRIFPQKSIMYIIWGLDSSGIMWWGYVDIHPYPLARSHAMHISIKMIWVTVYYIHNTFSSNTSAGYYSLISYVFHRSTRNFCSSFR